MFNKLTSLFYTQYIDTDDILDKYKDEIESIKYYVASETLFEGQYLPIIRNYAEYVYTLPASEYHHHSGEYGLFAHGLETAIGALQLFSARGISVRDAQQYEIKKLTREEKKRWKIALFCAAIMHDIGKTMASMTVSIEIGKHEDGRTTHKYWMPMYEPLFKFLDREDNYDYTIKWIQGRGVNHESVNPVFISAMIPKNVSRNLGIEKLTMILDAITPMAKPENVLMGFLKSSDHQSSKQASAHIVPGVGPSSAEKTKPQQSKRFEQASTLKPKAPTQTVKKREVLTAPNPKTKPEPAAIASTTNHEPIAPPAHSNEEKKKEGNQELSMETFVSSLRDLICAGKIEVNNPNHAAFMLLNKQAGWINTQALNRILKNIGLDKIQIKHHEYVEKLIKEGCISTIGEKQQNSIKAKVGKNPQIMFAVVKKITGIVTDINESYSGELKMPGKLQLNVIGLPESGQQQNAIKQTTDKNDFTNETIKVIEKVLAQAGEARVVTIEKKSFDDFIKKEVGSDAAPYVKKMIRKNNITSLDENKTKFSVIKAKEFLNRKT